MTDIDKQILENAHNNIPENMRRVAIFKDGTEKSFVDLVPGDEFKFKFDGKIESDVWFKCCSKPYVNERGLPTIKVESIQIVPD